jgi:DNA-damage-inducible protein J
MHTTTNLSILMNLETKKVAEKLFNSLGMNLPCAINIFIKQSLRTNGISFQITLDTPNNGTVATMEEASKLAKNQNAQTYAMVENPLAELKK